MPTLTLPLPPASAFVDITHVAKPVDIKAIAKNTKAQVLGVDIVNGALKIALNNAMHLDLMNKALFRKSDIFSKIRSEEKFDIIVSNPPYIPLKDKPELQIEVKDFEPSTALFTNDEEGVEFYEKMSCFT